MKICVINGSPRGEYSVTLHSLLYLQKINPNHSFEFLNVGLQIKKYEKDFIEAENINIKKEGNYNGKRSIWS